MQEDLFGNKLDKIASAQFVAHSMRHHRVKMYKSCPKCKSDVSNKPHMRFCWLCMQDFVISHDVIIPFDNPIVTTPVMCSNSV